MGWFRCLSGEGRPSYFKGIEEVENLRAEGGIMTYDIGTQRFQVKMGQEGTSETLAALERYRQDWIGRDAEGAERWLFRSVL